MDYRTPTSPSLQQHSSTSHSTTQRQSYLVDQNRTKLKVNTIPAWARNAQDDDALFNDSHPSPLTTKASRPSASTIASTSASSSAPLRPPPLALRKSRTQRYADARGSDGDDSSDTDHERPVHPRTPETATTATVTGDGPRHEHSLGWPHLNHHSHDPPREESHRPSGDWWQFTLPDKYKKKVEEYMSRNAEKSSHADGSSSAPPTGDLEKQEPDKQPARSYRLGSAGLSHMARRLPSTPGPFSMHHAQTPGWASPWQPFINHHRDPFIDLDHRDVNQSNAFASPTTDTFLGRSKNFLLHHYMAPLTFRVLNIIFCSLSLALAARIKAIENANGLSGVIGASTLYVIIVSPLSLIHIVVSLRAEYFGPPLGIWKVSSKMIFTLMELVFISVWSAALALAFNDEFTTPIMCTAWTPGGQFRGSDTGVTDSDGLTPSGSTLNELCSLQSALVSLVFCSVLLYAAVLIVSLFRIFNKVNRKS